MKRHIVALAIGSLFAAPVLANNEIDPGYASPTTFVNDHAGWVQADAEQGHVVALTMQDGGKSRAEVQAEVAQARRSGEYVVNAELGTTANQL
jgi:hypothetical protein